jgi:hypothetical protein
VTEAAEGLSPAEENAAMKVYLGGSRGYDPAGREERLRREYGPGWRPVQKSLDEYLAAVLKRPEGWTGGDVHAAAAAVDAVIEECFPWFDETARGLMVGCFIYEWK